MQDYANADYGDQWIAHLQEIKHPLIMGQQPQCEPIKRDLSAKENHMQDHAHDIRQMYIKDYAARVKLPPDEQRAMWIDHLKIIKHPRMEQITRREPIASLAEAVAKLEQERIAREAWKEI